MARTSSASPSCSPGRSPSRRVGGALAGIALAAVLAGSAVLFVSQQPGDAAGTGGSHADEVIVVCESPTVTHTNGVKTASAVAVRVPTGSPVPQGCHLG